MKTKRPWKEYGRYGSVGIELVLSVAIGFYGGRWLDTRFGGGRGWLTLLGFVVGVYAGFRQIFRASKEIERAADETERAERRARRSSLEDPVAPSPDPSQTDARDESESPPSDGKRGDDDAPHLDERRRR
jgi:ATP synthase protein I